MSVTTMSTEPVRRGRLQMSHWMMSKGTPRAVLLQEQRQLPETRALRRFSYWGGLERWQQNKQANTNQTFKCINAKWISVHTTLQERKIPYALLTCPYSHFSSVRSRCCLLLSSLPEGCYPLQCGSSRAILQLPGGKMIISNISINIA